MATATAGRPVATLTVRGEKAGPPRALLIASAVVILAAGVMAVVGAVKAGISTDEPIHVMRLRNFLDTGWYALDWDYVGKGPGSDGTNTFVYAPVTMLLLHAWSVLWGAESWGHVATTPHAYDVRHLGVVLIAMVGLVGVAALGRLLLRSWGWGVVAAAALSAIPMWTGHAMYNVKDIPVATGYTFVTLGAAALVRSGPPRVSIRIARGAAVAGGLVLAMGTRPGMWSGLFATLVATAVAVAIVSESRRVAMAALAELLASCLAAAVILVAIYPKMYAHPLEALPRTAEGSASFLGGLESDRLYVPRHLLEEMPTLLLVCVAIGSVVGIARALRAIRSQSVIGGQVIGGRVAAGRVALVGVQVFAMPIAAIVLGSDLYHGLRQLLFAAPASAVLAVYGMVWLLDRHRSRPGRGGARWRIALPVLMSAAVVLPIVDQALLFPYQPTYVNLATDLVVRPFSQPDERPGGDFWRISLPELIKGVDLDGQLLCKAKVTKDGKTAFRYTSNGGAYSTNRSLDCREEESGPLAPEKLPVRRELPPDQFLAVFLKKVPDNCTPVNSVSRWRHGTDVVLTVLGLCKDTAPPLDHKGVDTDTAALSAGGDHDLWRFASDGWEQWPNSDVLTAPVPLARIGLRPAHNLCKAGCEIHVVGTMPADLQVAVDGQEVTATRSADGVDVPVSADQGAADTGVWITLTRSSGGRLDATMTGLRLVDRVVEPKAERSQVEGTK